MASQPTILIIIYFATVELSATKFFFVDPNMKQRHEVLFRSVVLPTQFESIYPYNLTPSPPRHLRPYSMIHLKYLSTCFTATQCTCLGSTMNWLKVFTSKHIFDMFFVKYIKEPISCLYKLWSTKSQFELKTFFKLVTIGVDIGL